MRALNRLRSGIARLEKTLGTQNQLPLTVVVVEFTRCAVYAGMIEQGDALLRPNRATLQLAGLPDVEFARLRNESREDFIARVKMSLQAGGSGVIVLRHESAPPSRTAVQTVQ